MAVRYYATAAASTTRGTGQPSTTKSAVFPWGTNNTTYTTGPKYVEIDVAPSTVATNTGASWTSLAQTTQQSTFVGHAYMALAAGTFGAGTWSFALSGSETNASANSFFGVSIYVWRPGTSTVVGYIYDNNVQLGAEWATNTASRTFSVTGANVTAAGGDYLIVEFWHTSAQGATMGYAQTTSFDAASGTADFTADGQTALNAWIDAPTQIPAAAKTLTQTGLASTTVFGSPVQRPGTMMYPVYDDADVTRGLNDPNKAGVASNWAARLLSPKYGTSTYSANVATVSGPTAGVDLLYEWISAPLAAAVTISGPIVFNINALESNTLANATVGVVIERLSNTLSVVSTVVDSTLGTELGTSAARYTWTATPTSTSFNKGDRIRMRVYFDDNATTGNMASGYTLSFIFGGTLVYDSNVVFSETLSFMASPVMGWRSMSSATSTVSTIAYDPTNNVTLALGSGSHRRSTDGGVSWSTVSDDTSYVKAVWASGLGKFVGTGTLVSDGTTPSIKTSFDGITWAAASSPLSLNDIHYDATSGRLVGTAQTAGIYTSTDGTTWTLVQGPAYHPVFEDILSFKSVTSNGAGSWIAYAEGSGGAVLYTSSNGTTWSTLSSTQLPFIQLGWFPKAGMWIGVVGNGSTFGTVPAPDNGIYTSSNGSSWTLRKSFSWTSTVPGEIYGTSTLCVAANAKYIFTSSDGITWEMQTYVDTTLGNIYDVLYASTAGRWLAVTASTSSTYYVIGSSNGVHGPYAINATPTVLFLTNEASDIVDRGVIELKTWQASGTG